MKLLAIDGNSILNRAYYGIRSLSTRDGQPTNGIYGFLNILHGLLQELKPDAVGICFDLRAPTFRHKKYDGYKATRKGMPDDLAAQLKPLKNLLRALGFVLIEQEGFEADDLLGALACEAAKKGGSCVIATGDRDSFQLVDDKTTVRLASTKGGRPHAELIDIAAIFEKYGLTPKQLIDLKALMGDSSDNIPGVPGVGEKTALALMQAWGSLDNIYTNLETLDIRDSLREKLRTGKDMAYLSRELVTIDCCAPIGVTLDALKRGEIDGPKAWELVRALELFSLAERFGVKPVKAPAPAQEAPEEAKPAPPLEILFNPPHDDDLFDAEKPMDILFDFGSDGEVAAICVVGKTGLCFWDTQAGDVAVKLLAGKAPKRTNRLKELYHWAVPRGLEIENIRLDVEIAGYILNPTGNDYSIKRLAGEYQTPGLEIAGFFGAFGELLEECALFPALADKLAELIALQGQYRLLHEVELPLARVLAEMEIAGIALDSHGLAAFGERLDEQIARYQESVYAHAGQSFNLNSPKQLGVILFEKLELPVGKKTKTGYSTDADVLDSLLGKHPIIADILEYRKAAKLKSTYVDGLLKVVADDGRVHTSFQQTLTRTGRISSTEPNMQNIPIRTKLGSELRRFFRAGEGNILLDADYSQIELRVLAHIAEDANMIDAFLQDEDIHTRTASQVFDMPPAFVTSTMRSRAKAVNFGIVYGIGAFSLAQDIGVSVSEADKYIKGYLENFAGVRQYMDHTVESGSSLGYVQTLLGRRRYLPELASKNRPTREFGKRVAMNTPIQGTSADIIKIAMVKVFRRLREEGLAARLILQVHDELIVECPIAEADRAARLLKEEMEGAMELCVPLKADVSKGDTWLDAKS
ncbi:MAG: DNA polymerase I [Oscillospiraceae bacterium]|nr:DNA polymerase I [Oscillospiraceae bacterium]